MHSAVKYPEWYSHKSVNDVENILCYTKPGDNLANWKTVLLEDLIKPTFNRITSIRVWEGTKKSCSVAFLW
jgi:hypothetical protein